MRQRPQGAFFPKHLFSAIRRERPTFAAGEEVAQAVDLSPADLHERFDTRPSGLTTPEADARLAKNGPNELVQDRRVGLPRLFWNAAANPLVVLLIVLATVSLATGDVRAAIVMGAMIALGVGLKLFQEWRADEAAAALKSMISTTATVLRDGAASEIPLSRVVPGDVVQLAAGDMIPADVRIVTAKDLFVVQGSLTGESFSVEKFAVEPLPKPTSPIALKSVAYMGTSVESGTAIALVVATGQRTLLGAMAESIAHAPAATAFDRGVSAFTWLMIRFMAVMAPLVFLVSGLARGDWREAFFFAMAVAVGLTPEMLPAIVSICLTKGALTMSRKKVVVKRLDAIQNLGAMDVLCTDKTGTLTMDHVILERHCDVVLREDEEVLALAYLNSHFQTGLKNVLDRAVLAYGEEHGRPFVDEHAKVDEIPFDFQRRVMSVVVRTASGRDRIVSKGAPEAIFPRCQAFELDGVLHPMEHILVDELKEEYEQLSADGFRVLAIASKEVEPRGAAPDHATPYGKDDEFGLTLHGYIAFLDPPKDTAAAAIRSMREHGVDVKVVTGDNELVARKICKEVGIPVDHTLAGDQIEQLSDDALGEVVEATTLFARVSPEHKRRVIKALQSRGRTVGFMGDGINDAPALRAADVGVSVDTAADVAKESADLILLEKSLLVLETGVIEGRKVFANILKYARMGASSNFGNMFSVLGASALLPFLPMTPIQILANNLLYDFSQTAIPTDEVDPEQLEKPRPWDIAALTRFILVVGPCSSVFDYATFFLMLYGFGCWNVATPAAAATSQSLFQTGWFVESLLTQTLIIHLIRTQRLPFVESRASWPLAFASLVVAGVGVCLPYTTVGQWLGFSPLPAAYWPALAILLTLYAGLTIAVRRWMRV